MPFKKTFEKSLSMTRQAMSVLLMGCSLMMSHSAGADNIKPPNLYILVSFGMPQKSLVDYCKQAKKHKAVLVLRGLKNDSIKETANIINSQDLQQCQIQVEPRLFSQCNVNAVPVFLKFNRPLKPGDLDSKESIPSYRRVDGLISLNAAIDVIATQQSKVK